jgi:hypothetical protein
MIGLKLTATAVYALRGRIKRAGPMKLATAAPRARTHSTPAEPVTAGPRNGDEREFLERAMDLGFGRAAKLLAWHRERCASVMEG